MLKYVNHDIVFQEFPDEVTLAINLSLCPNGCPGCHSAYLQGNVGDELTEERLRAILDNYIGEITCVGFMGGDNDPARVMQLARMVQETYAGKLHTLESFIQAGTAAVANFLRDSSQKRSTTSNWAPIAPTAAL